MSPDLLVSDDDVRRAVRASITPPTTTVGDVYVERVMRDTVAREGWRRALATDRARDLIIGADNIDQDVPILVESPPEDDAALVQHLVSAAQVNNTHAMRAAAGVLVDRLDALRVMAADLASERTRRVVAQEALGPLHARVASLEMGICAFLEAWDEHPAAGVSVAEAANRLRTIIAE